MAMETGHDQGAQQTGQGDPEKDVLTPGEKNWEREKGLGNDPVPDVDGGKKRDQEPSGAQGGTISQSNNEQPFSPGKGNRVSDQGGSR
jgi:hypothetical protein